MARTYRGRHPKRIREVYRNDAFIGLVVVTNEGQRFTVIPRNTKGALNPPRVNQDIREIGASPDHNIFILTPIGD